MNCKQRGTQFLSIILALAMVAFVNVPMIAWGDDNPSEPIQSGDTAQVVTTPGDDSQAPSDGVVGQVDPAPESNATPDDDSAATTDSDATAKTDVDATAKTDVDSPVVEVGQVTGAAKSEVLVGNKSLPTEEEPDAVNSAAAATDLVEMTVNGTSRVYQQTEAQLFFNDLQSAAVAEVKLLSDFKIETGVHIPVADGQTVALDFNGFTLSKSDSSPYAPIENFGTMTLLDSAGDKIGGISGSNRCVNNSGAMTIEGGHYRTIDTSGGTAVQNKTESAVMTIDDCTVKAGYFAFYNAGTATINGGSFSNESCSKCNPDYAYTAKSAGTLYFNGGQIDGIQGALAIVKGNARINGGEFTTHVCKTHGAGNAFYALYVAGEDEAAKCVVNDGVFGSEGSHAAVLVGNDNKNGDGGINAEATSQIFGGTFTATLPTTPALMGAPETGNPSVYGGTFSSPVDASYCADGYSPVDNGDGTYGVAGNAAAILNSDNSVKATYASLKEAVAAAEITEFSTKAAPANATVIKLLKDTNDGLDIGTSGVLLQNIVLDLDGHTLTLGPAVGSTGTETNGLRVLSYSKIEIKNGTITSSDMLNDEGGYVKFMLVNYGTMKLEDVTVNPGEEAWLGINNRGALTLVGNTTVNDPTAGYKQAITNDVYDFHYSDFDASLTVEDASVKVDTVSVERYYYDRRGNEGSVVLNISAGTFGEIVNDGKEVVGLESNVTGGTFSVDPSEYCAPGYAWDSSTKQVSIKTCKIDYALAGGTLADGVTNPTSYTYFDEGFTLANPTKAGYTFAGWTGTGLTKPSKSVTIAKGSMGDRSYTATWSANEARIAFEENGGPAVSDIVGKTDDQVTGSLPQPTRAGYVFIGWYAEKTLTTQVTQLPATFPAGTITYYAKWNAVPLSGSDTEIQVEVPPPTDDGSAYAQVPDDTVEAAAEQAQGALETIKNGGVPAGMSEADAKAVADLIKDVSDDDTVSVVVSLKFEEKAEDAIDSGEKAAIEGASKGGEAVALYLDLSVTMTVKVSKASGVKDQKTVSLDEVSEPLLFEVHVDPALIQGKAVRLAHVHNGKTEIINPESVDRAKGTISFFASSFSTYALLTSETVTVTFESNGGTTVDPQTLKFGEKAAKPADPTRTGFVFGGWFSDETLGQAYDFAAPVESSITLYAKWTQSSTIKKLAATGDTTGTLVAGAVALTAIAGAALGLAALRRRRSR